MQFTPGRAPLSPKQAAEQMAVLLKQELDLEVSPERIMTLFESRWATLSRLAHSIHRKQRQGQ